MAGNEHDLPRVDNAHEASRPRVAVRAFQSPDLPAGYFVNVHPLIEHDGTSVTYIFKQHCTLMATPIAVSQRRDKSSRIDLQQGLWFLVRVYFNILIRDPLDLQCYPNTLNKRTGWRVWLAEIEPLLLRSYPWIGNRGTHQKQDANNLRSLSFERFLTVKAAKPVALLWYVFCCDLFWSDMVLLPLVCMFKRLE